MTPQAQDFLSRLEGLNPDTNDDLVGDLYDITDPLREDSSARQFLEAMLQFMESHPEADFGAPGPLVSIIEQHRGFYENLLAQSIARAPMYATLNMVNRILNSGLEDAERVKWLKPSSAFKLTQHFPRGFVNKRQSIWSSNVQTADKSVQRTSRPLSVKCSPKSPLQKTTS
jgi:hypothetical protein